MAWVNANTHGNTKPSAPLPAPDDDMSPAFTNSEPRVGFDGRGGVSSEDCKERDKYLTAKYPKHTMGLIRKRLAVEDWIDEQLKLIYEVPENSLQTYDADIDLDDILNIDDDDDKIKYLEECLSSAPQSPAVVKQFIEELLEKVRDL